jgi:hypothetical protein
MVADLDLEPRVDRVVGQVRVAVLPAAGDRALGLAVAEADRAAGRLAAREDPMKAIERADVEHRVVLEGAEDAGRGCALGRSVGAVHEHQAVRAPLVHEVGERSVDLALQLFVADERHVAHVAAVLPWQIEEPVADELAPWLFDHLGAVVVEHVADVGRRVAPVTLGILGEQLEVFAERQDGLRRFEPLFEGLGDAVELGQRRRAAPGFRFCHAGEVKPGVQPG